MSHFLHPRDGPCNYPLSIGVGKLVVFSAFHPAAARTSPTDRRGKLESLQDAFCTGTGGAVARNRWRRRFRQCLPSNFNSVYVVASHV